MNRLLHDVAIIDTRGDPASVDIRSVAFDSRQVVAGALFCCVPGALSDGHDFAAQAVSAGASALLCEHFLDLDLDVVQARLAAGGVRPAMARAAAAIEGHPSRSLTTVGVTGTNGKTTVTHLVRAVLDAAGVPAGVIGTLDGERTTPEAPVLQHRLAELRDGGYRAVAMEVSSHALTQHRVDGVDFDVAAFTNLSHDHLDHHRTMEEYFAAKAELFRPERTRVAVVNADDPWGRRLLELLGSTSGVTPVPVGRHEASDVRLRVGSTSFRWRGREVTVPLTGSFNVDNALVAASVATALGVGEDDVARGLTAAGPVLGRMEVVDAGQPFAVLVDFAHTPAGLEVVLGSARRLAAGGRVVCVFGCGGDRDPTKRPEMGEVVGRLADVAVVTSDNPRSEDPGAIIAEVLAGISGTAEVVVEPDRFAAVGRAVAAAGPGDVVVVAGKGHESTQTSRAGTVPFDDRLVARQVLAGLGYDGAGTAP
jgi:UDP-N-acetylmuramoyl-L-alanyl-D-glutamate--2,6-diaminopimelate ligase